MSDLKCDECGFVGHSSEWKTERGHIRWECPFCGTDKSDAFEIN